MSIGARAQFVSAGRGNEQARLALLEAHRADVLTKLASSRSEPERSKWQVNPTRLCSARHSELFQRPHPGYSARASSPRPRIECSVLFLRAA